MTTKYRRGLSLATELELEQKHALDLMDLECRAYEAGRRPVVRYPEVDQLLEMERGWAEEEREEREAR